MPESGLVPGAGLTMSGSELRTDEKRLWASLMEMAEIGATPKGGSCRLALSDEDKRGRDLFVAWCEAIGCSVTVDQMGNIFARRVGANPDRPPVAMGSHLDTQPHGGKFDGVYGVLAGLEVLRTLTDQNIETESPLEVVVWTNEEGSRFAPAMIASAVFAGVFELDFGLSRTDPDGKTLGGELARIGYAGEALCGEHEFGAFFEAHIEQGPILEREERTIGVVRGAQGARWYDVMVKGQDAHAGSTPMSGRRDALVGASKMIESIQGLALAHAPDAVSTVGQLEVLPNSRNTIPGEVRFSIDLRHADAAVLATLDTECRELCESIAGKNDVTLDLKEIWYQPPVAFDEDCIDAVRRSAGSLGYSHRDMFSGAGHDSCLVCRVAPTGMIFVPCEGGISHNETESATPSDLSAGCDVLLHAVLQRAG